MFLPLPLPFWRGQSHLPDLLPTFYPAWLETNLSPWDLCSQPIFSAERTREVREINEGLPRSVRGLNLAGLFFTGREKTSISPSLPAARTPPLLSESHARRACYFGAVRGRSCRLRSTMQGGRNFKSIPGSAPVGAGQNSTPKSENDSVFELTGICPGAEHRPPMAIESRLLFSKSARQIKNRTHSYLRVLTSIFSKRAISLFVLRM